MILGCCELDLGLSVLSSLMFSFLNWEGDKGSMVRRKEVFKLSIVEEEVMSVMQVYWAVPSCINGEMLVIK